ncbi:MAG: MBL fold metallo-hydrolase [Verrucomicrobiota bacterium]
MSWDVVQHKGIHLPQIDWWLDATRPVPRSFVSHAHSDHIGRHEETLCTAATARFMRLRQRERGVKHLLPFGQTEQLTPDCTATLLPAGHILGSAQILLEHSAHGRLLYTGDFKLRPGLAAEPCATPRADVLIMETTFGLPRYRMPPSDQVMADIVGFCRDALAAGETPILFGYSLGKSQEIIRGLLDAGLPVMAHAKTHEMCLAYAELGTPFDGIRLLDTESPAGHVLLIPPQAGTAALFKKIPRRRTAVVTGWALDAGARFRHRVDAAFPLSDHADYPDLLRFVEAVNPARVHTVHGFAREFAADLRRRGREAWALGRDNQLEMPLADGGP